MLLYLPNDLKKYKLFNAIQTRKLVRPNQWPHTEWTILTYTVGCISVNTINRNNNSTEKKMDDEILCFIVFSAVPHDKKTDTLYRYTWVDSVPVKVLVIYFEIEKLRRSCGNLFPFWK